MDVDVRILGPIATVCASTLATTLWCIARLRKRASLSIMRAEPLIAIKGAARKMVRVYFGDKSIESSHVLHLSLRNDGNVPISVSDYQLPFRIQFNADARILETEVIETWPADLDRRVASGSLIKHVEKSAVEFTPVLLNAKDEIVVQVVIENFHNQIDISQHITGITAVNLWRESRMVPKLVNAFGAAIVIFAAFFMEPDKPYLLAMPSIPYMLILVLGCMLFWFGQIWPQSERSRRSVSPMRTQSLTINERKPQEAV